MDFSETHCIITGIDELNKDTQNDTNSSNIIEIRAICLEDKFHFNISSKLGISLTNSFSKNYQLKLVEIIKYASAKTNEIEFEPYVEFFESKNDIVFVLPAAGLNAEVYFGIIHKFSNFHMVLFNNYYEHLKQRSLLNDDITYEYLAQFYIKYIKKIQPTGPYTLMGWSLGGQLALEIARQLIEEAEIVGILVFIDPFFNQLMANKK